MEISPEHRRFLLLQQGVGAAVINLLINGAIAWGLFRSLATVPLWGQESIAGDTVATAFILPLLTTLIVSKIVGGQVALGKIERATTAAASGWLGLLAARRPVVRGAMIGAVCVVVAALPVVAGFSVVEVEQLPFSSFLGFKAAFGGVLGGLVTPLIAWAAILDASAP